MARTLTVAAAALLMAVGSAAAGPLPPVFPQKQLLIRTDRFIRTQLDRPGDGDLERIESRWRAFSHDLTTYPDDDAKAIRRKRTLDWLYYPANNGRILRMNNLSEFCAWAKDDYIREVEFVDLGLWAGKDDCDKPFGYYYRTQHPENEEAFYTAPGGVGKPLHNPFLGRPTDAMYGDFFFLESEMEQRVGDISGKVSWQELGEGEAAEGYGTVRYYLQIKNEDILPLKILQIALVADAEDERPDPSPERIDTLVHDADYPEIFAPGEIRTYRFEESDAMAEIFDVLIRLYFVVDFEDPTGKSGRKKIETYYWKSAQ